MAAAGLALVALAVSIAHHARSQSAPDGPPAPLCSDRLALHESGVAWSIPACFNHQPDVPDSSIHRVVIGIHGLDRFANAAFGSLVEASRTAHVTRSTLILAPQFLTETERDRYSLGSEVPCWKGSRWIQGDESLRAPTRRSISSYRIVDLLLERLADPTLFPNLRTIVVAGHSGGGQFVQRYAAGTTMAENLRNRGIDVRFVVANPSSYLYFTAERPVSLSEGFAIPADRVRRSAPYFDNYKYGLNRLNSYMRSAGASRIRARYIRRRVTYLLGERDNDPRHPQLDRGEAAELEGPTRLERGTAYFRYLRHLYGPSISATQLVRIVPNVGHSARRMFGSNEGVSALFGVPTASVALR